MSSTPIAGKTKKEMTEEQIKRLQYLRRYGYSNGTIIVFPTIPVAGIIPSFKVIIDSDAAHVDIDDQIIAKMIQARDLRLFGLLEKIREESLVIELETRELAQKEAADRPRKPQNHRDGIIYLLCAESGHYKIGRTINLEQRLSSLAKSTPYQFDLILSFAVSDAVAAERFLHDKFNDKRLQGEWFTLTPEDVNYFVLIPEGDFWKGEFNLNMTDIDAAHAQIEHN